jgi:hypothetical protein
MLEIKGGKMKRDDPYFRIRKKVPPPGHVIESKKDYTRKDRKKSKEKLKRIKDDSDE